MARYPSSAGYAFGPGCISPAVKILVITNVVAFVLNLIVGPVMTIRLGFSPQAVFEQFALWQPLTYMFLHSTSGFGHILFQPNAKHCHVAPYAFHPMYNSAVPRGSLWGAHNTNVCASDEIGHFEYCDAINPSTGACSNPGAGDPTLDEDDQFCLDGSNYPGAQPIIGCVLDDGDFDGPSYQKTWPGTFVKPRVDRRLHGTAFTFTAASSNDKRGSAGSTSSASAPAASARSLNAAIAAPAASGLGAPVA